jgi:hypothetical protein
LDIINQAKAFTETNSAFKTKCIEAGVGGGIFLPFWHGFPHYDIHHSITPDVLHQLYQGVFKHMLEWLGGLMSEEELDACIRSLPPCCGL